jgi:hypothetical protein
LTYYSPGFSRTLSVGEVEVDVGLRSGGTQVRLKIMGVWMWRWVRLKIGWFGKWRWVRSVPVGVGVSSPAKFPII